MASVTQRLPPLDANDIDSVLSSDLRVQVVDAINISKSRAQQIEALVQQTRPEKDQTINELVDDEDRSPVEVSATMKYTVKDVANELTFLLPLKPLTSPLRLGSFVTIQRGTRIWRSVLCPNPKQILNATGGEHLSVEQQLRKLRSMEAV